jgi:hypothetical protein
MQMGGLTTRTLVVHGESGGRPKWPLVPVARSWPSAWAYRGNRKGIRHVRALLVANQ